VFQEYALFPHLTVAQNVAYGLAARGVRGRARRERVGAMLERLDIAGLAGERPSRLSGGQRQRVALARALVLEPSVVLLDEPLAALDVQTRSSVRGQLRNVLGDLGVPCLLVTHDYADVLAFQRRVVILVDGKVVQDGPHTDLLAHPRSKFVADFTGVNFYAGSMRAHDAFQLATVDVAPGVRFHAMAEDVPSGKVSIALKPWDVTLSPLPPEGSARNALAGIVQEVQPAGGRVRVLLEVGEPRETPLVAEISLEALAALGCTPGQALVASFKATALSVEPA
jgi:molybdate transport system ATP-binding protein